ncbi:uncharacterized protein LOC130452986 isoform X1 [Diorhabda sublineata]|uniref:uncharacterized protein LOC130452986 isoform X1 n=1 Tax=Diorhabda sublineata TaxID=1163346 RepID=UPI0024E120ED|nr:uncharacterized protein LOC130452986 isoform X1 [Diorhabda sublineata]
MKCYLFVIFLTSLIESNVYAECKFPKILRGLWFSIENGQNTLTDFTETEMIRAKEDKVTCTHIRKEHNVAYKIILKNKSCYTCMKVYVRTINVIEKIESSCVNISPAEVSIDSVCKNFDHTEKLITLFYDQHNHRGHVNCQNTLAGVLSFTYERPNEFSGICNSSESIIKSCKKPDVLSLSSNEKFEIIYKKCVNIPETNSEVVEYGCLGDWYYGKNHYFVIFNTKESRNGEKYRCLVRNDEDDFIVGKSRTAECNTLKSPKESPEILYINNVKLNPSKPVCHLSKNFVGEWVDSANVDANIVINETHIIESNIIGGKLTKTIYICKELRLNTAMMTKLSTQGCQSEYTCFEFERKDKNFIRYRKGKSTFHYQFERACSYPFLINDNTVKYDFYFKNNPNPTTCPFVGNFNFTQKGDVPLETRYIEVASPNSSRNPNCKDRSEISVSKTNRNQILIFKTNCSQPTSNDYKNKPDYVFKCIANWEENKKSFLLTFDEFDPIYQYRCWVYEKIDQNNILISQAMGSSCNAYQTAASWNYTEGATVALKLQRNEHNSTSSLH